MPVKKFAFPTDIYLGPHSVNSIPQIVSHLGNKVLLLTNKKQFQNSDQVENLRKNLSANDLNVLLFEEIDEQADCATVDTITKLAKSTRCEVVIGVGGSITLNIAKAVSLMCSNLGECVDYLTEQDGYRLSISHDPLPSVMVPTHFATLESVYGFVVKDHHEGINKKLYNKKVRPTACVLDPKMIHNFSKKLLADSGLLILSYAFDAYISSQASTFSDMFSQTAVELVRNNLSDLLNEPHNEKLILQLLKASLMASYAANVSGLGGIFAFCESVTSLNPLYKGAIASLILPHFMEYNLTAVSDKYVQIAKLFGVEVGKLSVVEVGIKVVEQVRLYLRKFNIPSRLSEVGLTKASIAKLIPIFERFEESKRSPRPIFSQDISDLIERAY